MKKIITLSLILLMCFMLGGCKSKDENTNNNDRTNEPGIQIGEYQVTKKGKSVFVITSEGAAISTTEYKFDDDKIAEATITQTYTTNDLAKTMYDQMKKEPQIAKQYADIKAEENNIILTLKKESLTAYINYNQNQLYDLMKEMY